MSQIAAVYFDLSNDLWLIQNMYLHFKNRRINSIPALRQALVLQTISARRCGHGACEGTNPDHFGDLPLSIPLANVSLFMVLFFTSQEFNRQCRCKGPLCIVVAVIYCDRFFGLFAFRCWIVLQRFLVTVSWLQAYVNFWWWERLSWCVPSTPSTTVDRFQPETFHGGHGKDQH